MAAANPAVPGRSPPASTSSRTVLVIVNWPNNLRKQIESPRGGQPDQWACVGRDEPFRHASTARVSSRTVAEAPSTTGMPSWDTRSMNYLTM